MTLVLYYLRDYTNPYLPVAPSAIDGSGQVICLQLFFHRFCLVACFNNFPYEYNFVYGDDSLLILSII